MRERRIIENIIFFLYETIRDIGIPGTYFISSVSRVPPPIFTTTTVTPGAMTKGFTLHVFSSTRREKKRSYFDGNKNVSHSLGSRNWMTGLARSGLDPAPRFLQLKLKALKFYYIKKQTVHCKGVNWLCCLKDILYDGREFKWMAGIMCGMENARAKLQSFVL